MAHAARGIRAARAGRGLHEHLQASLDHADHRAEARVLLQTCHVLLHSEIYCGLFLQAQKGDEQQTHLINTYIYIYMYIHTYV